MSLIDRFSLHLKKKLSVEEYIDKLREESIYIKLQSDKKFGGAVDINSLIKALSSINLSYKKFLEVELNKSDDVRTTTPTGKRELKNFIADSELLIVDLDFASFGAAISPNIATVQSYTNIKNSLQLKKQNFDTYKHDVLNFNYSDNHFLEHVTNKYTPQERSDIYKPIIENLINSPKFKFYYGKNKESLKSAPATLKNTTIEKLLSVPSLSLDPNKVDEQESMYVIYVTSSEEDDLFGKKPKFSKVLATSKLEKAVYPYQLNEIRIGKQVYNFNKKLSAEVTYEDNMYFISYPDLNIEVWGDERPVAEEAFYFALQSVIKNIYLEKDENLTKKAIMLKEQLARIIKTVN